MADSQWSTFGKKKKLTYLDAMKKLYGNQTDRVEGEKPPQPVKVTKKRPINNTPTEAVEQEIYAWWLDQKRVLYTASANGGVRSAWEGSKLKRSGVKAGYPDVDIKEARKGYHGLLIELKRTQGGKIDPLQQWWHDKLNEKGYLAVFCYGAEQAKKVTCDYFGWAYEKEV